VIFHPSQVIYHPSLENHPSLRKHPSLVQLPKKQWTELNAVAHPKQPAIHPDLLALNVTATTFTIQHSKAIQSSN
jgi:hypothetical protein